MVARPKGSYLLTPPHGLLPPDARPLSDELQRLQSASEAASALAHTAAISDAGGPNALDAARAARFASIHAAEAAFRMTDANRGTIDARTAIILAQRSILEAQGALDAAWALLGPAAPPDETENTL